MTCVLRTWGKPILASLHGLCGWGGWGTWHNYYELYIYNTIPGNLRVQLPTSLVFASPAKIFCNQPSGLTSQYMYLWKFHLATKREAYYPPSLPFSLLHAALCYPPPPPLTHPWIASYPGPFPCAICAYENEKGPGYMRLTRGVCSALETYAHSNSFTFFGCFGNFWDSYEH